MSSPTYAVYARPVDVKTYLGVTDIVDDDLLLTCCEWARGQIDTKTRRHFWPKVATELYDVTGGRELVFRDDLISITTLTNGDSTTVSSDDYYLYPASGPPYGWLEIDESSGELFTYTGSPQQALSLAAVWGYDEITADSGATVSSAYSASGTSLTPSDMSVFAVGDLLKIGSDYLYVTALGSTTLTVKPGVNGATSAAHDAAAVIYFVRFPDEIANIAMRLAAWRFKQMKLGFEKTANPALGVVTIPSAIPPDIEDDLKRWVRRRAH